MEEELIFMELVRDFEVFEKEVPASELMFKYRDLRGKILPSATLTVKAVWLSDIKKSLIKVYAEIGDLIPEYKHMTGH